MQGRKACMFVIVGQLTYLNRLTVHGLKVVIATVMARFVCRLSTFTNSVLYSCTFLPSSNMGNTLTTLRASVRESPACSIIESVDSICRDSADTQYMLIQKKFSKSPKQLTYMPL